MDKDVSSIYSIGHGNKKINEFLKEIKNFDIGFVVDVRTKPYSKFNTDFNQGELKYHLQTNDIKYVFMGDLLGGLPNDDSCYINGKVDYDILKDKYFFKEGLERLVRAHNKRIKIVIMCSETDPRMCHRTKLIGKQLLIKYNIDIKHIFKNEIKVQSELEKQIFGLFYQDPEFNLSSRKSYR